MLHEAKEWAPAHIAAAASREPRSAGEEVVLLVDILSSEVNSGYDEQRWAIVTRVHDHEVRNLIDVVRLVERPDGGPFVVLTLDRGDRVTLDRQRAVATGQEVLRRYEISADRSARLTGVGEVDRRASLRLDRGTE